MLGFPGMANGEKLLVELKQEVSNESINTDNVPITSESIVLNSMADILNKITSDDKKGSSAGRPRYLLCYHVCR